MVYVPAGWVFTYDFYDMKKLKSIFLKYIDRKTSCILSGADVGQTRLLKMHLGRAGDWGKNSPVCRIQKETSVEFKLYYEERIHQKFEYQMVKDFIPSFLHCITNVCATV